MTRIHANNFETTLNGNILIGDTSATLTSVTGFPTIGGGVTCNLTLEDGATREIVKATARSGFVITIVRAQEDTSAIAFASGSMASLRATRDSIDSKQDSISGASLTAVTVATNDKIIIQDTSDSNNIKTVTAQSIADLASGGLVSVPNGGTGDTSFTTYSVLCGGTTSTGALQNVSGLGTSGQVLTSGGPGLLPTWMTPSGGGGGGTFPGSSTDNALVRFDGTGGSTVQNSGVIVDDSNNITGAASYKVVQSKLWSGLAADATCNSFGQFAMAASTGSSLNLSAYGYNTLHANTSGTGNSAFGAAALASVVTGIGNTACGQNALTICTNNENSAMGDGALASVTSGGYMVGLGASSGSSVATGNYNIFIGFNASSGSTSPTGVIAIGANSIADKSTGSTSGTNGPGIAIGSTGQPVGARGDGSVYPTNGASLGFWRIKLNGTIVKIQIYADA